MLSIGDIATISGTCATLAGVAADPSTLALVVVSPSGITTNFSWAGGAGGSGTISRDGVGAYHVTLPTLTESGTWLYRWTSTGGGVDAATGDLEFYVRARLF